jgi:gluconolactonase
MTVEVSESEMKDLIDPTAELERVAQGFIFTEGPVWDQAKLCLYFSDIPANTMYRYSGAKGAEVYRKPSNFSNGLTIDHQGRLIACEHQTHRVTREGKDGVEVVVDSYQGKRLNSPNDVVVGRDGSLIFTDPPYGLMEGLGGPREPELSFRGVYRLAPDAKEPTLLVDDFATPNGLALTADESRLYVDDTERGHIRVFDVADGWALLGGDLFIELKGEGEGNPDGMKLDAVGNIYCTGPGGIWICSPNAVVLGHIRMPEVAANLCWGEENARTMYITASTSLYRLQCLTGGIKQ